MKSFRIDSSHFSSLAGRTALITGGSSGIGLATAILLSSLHCNVVIGDLLPPLERLSTSIVFQETDVTSYPSLLALFHRCKSSFDTYPDIILANAGISERQEVIGDGISDEDVLKPPRSQTLAVNLEGVINTIRIGWWGLKSTTRPGSIILTSALGGYVGSSTLPMYSTSKHALTGLVRSLSLRAPASNLSISLIAPSITLTPLLTSRRTSLSLVATGLEEANVPTNTKEEVAEAVVWLVLRGSEANGVGLLVQEGECVDLERGLRESRGVWMGEKQVEKLRKVERGIQVSLKGTSREKL